MPQIKLFAFVAALSLLHHVVAQQSCIATCTDSANVLTQLKSCSGCGTDDWACFCRCQQYMDALMSCVQQNCDGSDIQNSVVSFCSNQGVPISYSSGSVSIGSSTISVSSTSISSSANSETTSSTTGTATTDGAFLSSAVAGSSGYSGSSFTATQSSDISSYLATALPAGVRTESSDACFVNTPYTYYSTPTWYSSLPTQAQSYYSSLQQGNTAACTLSPSAAAALAGSNSGGHHGLSGGAIAGIVIGSIIAALLLALLLWLCLRRRRRARRDAAANRARNYEPRNMQNGTYANEKGLVGGAVPTSNTRGAHAPYHNGGSNGFTTAGSQMPHGAGVYGAGGHGAGGHGVGGHGAPAGAVGAAALGANGRSPDYSHTTTTTVRTMMRPRPKQAPIPSSPPTRPAPQPIPNSGPIENSPPQNMSSRPAGRRAF